jgi:hypothetical protein
VLGASVPGVRVAKPWPMAGIFVGVGFCERGTVDAGFSATEIDGDKLWPTGAVGASGDFEPAGLNEGPPEWLWEGTAAVGAKDGAAEGLVEGAIVVSVNDGVPEALLEGASDAATDVDGASDVSTMGAFVG